jgi:hypothetical protein
MVISVDKITHCYTSTLLSTVTIAEQGSAHRRFLVCHCFINNLSCSAIVLALCCAEAANCVCRDDRFPKTTAQLACSRQAPAFSNERGAQLNSCMQLPEEERAEAV